MHGHTPCRDEPSTARLSVADIFRSHGDAYRHARPPNPEQHRVMRAIEKCRTSALGGHLDRCDRCGYQRPSYNSCRNRHCPTCQSLAQARWIEQRIERIVPTHYFHVVFTLPAELRPLALANRRLLFTILFRSASQTLGSLAADPRRLGALLGITAVLHTWTRSLQFHPHLHCVVTGGGLSPDGRRWISTKSPNYLFPVRALSSLFRAKFLRALRSSFRHGELNFTEHTAALAVPEHFDRFIDRLYRRDWVVYAKRPFGGPHQVLRYLGRYTHRVAISNQRLIAIDHHGIRLRTRGDQHLTLQPVEFIRRFLLHVLPPGFVKIRHYGLFAPAMISTKLEQAALLLRNRQPHPGSLPSSSTTAAASGDWRAQLAALGASDLLCCPRCRCGTMLRYPIPHPQLVAPDTS